MARILARRRCLHKNLAHTQRQNRDLKSLNTQLQALANVGSASAMIAHEINNLLTPLASYASFALEHTDDRALAEKALTKTVQNCKRAREVTESILALSNGKKQETAVARVRDLAEQVFTCLCRDFAKDGVLVKLDIPENVRLRCVPIQIQQVLMNLILNARDAMLGNRGTLTITATENRRSVCIDVRDTGRGIAAEDIKNVFGPFYTTKTGGDADEGLSGFGIGLAFCKRVIDEHGGAISLRSKPSKGTTFHITLPKAL